MMSDEKQGLLSGAPPAPYDLPVVNTVQQQDDPRETGTIDESFVEETDDEQLVQRRKTLWLRARYYFPVLSWLPEYKLSYLLNDFIAGSSVAFMIIPQGISYASLASLPAQYSVYGLYGAFFPLIVYSIFGTSRQMSIGPEAVVALLTGETVRSVGDDDAEAKLVLIGVLNFLVGTFTLVMGLFRLGFLDVIFSRATNRGFVTGVAAVVMTEQLVGFFGLCRIVDGVCKVDAAYNETTPLGKLIFVLKHLGDTQWLPTVFSLCAFGYMLLMDVLKRKFTKLTFLKFVPNILIVVLVSIFFSWVLELKTTTTMDFFKDLQPGFQPPRFPQFTSENLARLAPSAVVIVIVGFVESIIVGKTMAARNNYALSDNRELVAFGASNLFASLFGAYSSFGSMPRTRMNDAAGAKTQMAGFITAVYVFFAIMFMLPAFEYLPKATASAIVMFAAYSLLEAHDFIFFYQIRAWFDIVVALSCFLVTYIIGVEVGVFFTLAICIGMLVKTVTKDAFLPMGFVASSNTFQPLSPRNPEVKWVDGILIIQFLDSMYYANSGLFKERLRRLELFGSLGVHPGSEVRDDKLTAVVFDFARMPTIDTSALSMLQEVFADYNNRNIGVLAVQMNDHVRELMDRAHISELLKYGRNFGSIQEAVSFVKNG